MTSHALQVRNVNDAFYEGWWWMRTVGVRESSRNGPVLVAPGPVLTEYTHSWERVLFNPKRDANPVFHLMECYWMIMGSNDVEWLKQFNARIADYCENNIMHGAYGHRWLHHFGVDQLKRVIEILKNDPNSRQAVIQMWDPKADLYGTWRDRPCNTNIYLDCRGGSLNMTVCCRSNDMLWGAYGANAVHFSFLQEILAHEIGVNIGILRQFSNNFHAYTENEQVKEFIASPPFESYNYYKDGIVEVIPILNKWEEMEDLVHDAYVLIFNVDKPKFRTKFAETIAYPMMKHYIARKKGYVDDVDWMTIMPENSDWKAAYQAWIARRENKDGGQ